jgi:exonuclease VII large subunit
VRVPRSGVAEVCSTEAAGLTDWPIERITEAVEPTDAQRAALNELKDATAKAVDLMKSACPSDLPGTPTGRLAAMRTRIETMMQALAAVRPPLERFYNSLSDEQKARFNALSDEQPSARRTRTASRQTTDLTRACPAEMTASMPIDRVRQLVQPSAEQVATLDELNEASRKAAELLRANCEEEQSLTPPGRVAAMERRLNAMLEALNTVQPALERFYSSLSDEQKERFNQLGTRQARR